MGLGPVAESAKLERLKSERVCQSAKDRFSSPPCCSLAFILSKMNHHLIRATIPLNIRRHYANAVKRACQKKIDTIVCEDLEEMKKMGTFKSERIIASPQSNHIMTGKEKVINMCANNYLGWCDHPGIRETTLLVCLKISGA